MFIFVLFNNNFYRKIVDLSGIRTRIVGVEGEYADHLTTTTALGIRVILNWANPGFFLFIFVLFKHNIIEKTLGFSGIRTRIVGVEGEHADHLTTTTAQLNICLMNLRST